MRGNGEIAGLVSLAFLGLVAYGLWLGGAQLWHGFRGDGPVTFVECRSGSDFIFQGNTKHGIHKSGGRIELEELSGTKVSIDGSVICVSRIFHP